jgi:hypothetical protein
LVRKIFAEFPPQVKRVDFYNVKKKSSGPKHNSELVCNLESFNLKLNKNLNLNFKGNSTKELTINSIGINNNLK